MLTCKQFLEELGDYIDGEVDAEIRQRIEEHLTHCSNCWVICDTTKKTVEVYKGQEPQPLPPEIQALLIRAIEKKTASLKRHA